MHIIVCVKQVLDTHIPIQVQDNQVTQKEPIPVYVANPKDLAALEEAMFLKEQYGGRVTVISLGAKRVESVLCYCLARGVDQAIRIDSGSIEDLTAFAKVRLLGKVIAREDYDLVLCGDRSQDEGTSHVVPFLADFLGGPCITKVVQMEVIPERHLALTWRQTERGWREELECGLPAVFGIERSTHERKYVSTFANQQAARNGAIECLGMEQVAEGEQDCKWLKVVAISPPRPRTKKVFVPETSLSAEERFQLLMSGGTSQKQESDFVKGTPEQVAKEVIEFLRDKGLFPEHEESS